jgi:hypothetical protein
MSGMMALMLNTILSIAVVGSASVVCGKKMERIYPDVIAMVVILLGLTYVDMLEARCFVVAMSVLIYSRIFLNGNVIKHEILFAMVYVIMFGARLLALIISRIILGVTMDTPIMTGVVGTVVLFLQYGITVFALWLGVNLYKKEYKIYTIEFIYAVLAASVKVTIMVTLISFLNKYFANGNFTVGMEKILAMLLMVLELMVLSSYCVIAYLQRTNKEKVENRLLWEKYENEQQKILSWQQDYYEARKLRHDLKQTNEMYALMLRQGKIDEVCELLKGDTAFEQIYTYSEGNGMINAVINDYMKKCKSDEISLKVSIDKIALGIIENDIAVVLMNLLENAHRAELNSKGKEIKLNMHSYNSMYNIICKNKIDESVLEKNPDLVSDKGDLVHHGLGIVEIKNTINKYDGMIDFLEEDGYFVVHMMIPCVEGMK